MLHRLGRLAGVLAVVLALCGFGLYVGAAAEQPVAAAVTDHDGQNSTWMSLRIDGEQIEGDTYSDRKKGMIELSSFRQSVTTAREAGSGLATGRRQYQPLLIRKRIDKASPLLMRALTNSSVVDAQFGFYRPNLSGDGTEERFYEIEIRNGRVASVEIVMDEQSGVPVEEVTFVFHTITWTYTDGGITHEDTWEQRR